MTAPRAPTTDQAAPPPAIVIGLSAVIIAVVGDQARVLVAREPVQAPPALPFGPFDPDGDRTFEIALRAFVREQTGFELGYVEQLYTFGDRGRDAPRARMPGAERGAEAPSRVISVSYLALAPAAQETALGRWADWYAFFPWEDWRAGRPDVLDTLIRPKLHAWADGSGTQGRRAARWARAREAFGFDGAPWNEERVLDRYELLYEAALTPEAAVDRGDVARAPATPDALGRHMASDHRRILATAIQRLRGKIKYRPVVFELTPPLFTLSTLQCVVEAILGLRLHKQNFRRGLINAGLVEGVGAVETATGGRPAELHRFRREAASSRLDGRQALGVSTPRLKET